MNNEEKILELLREMNGRLEKLESAQAEMQATQMGMQAIQAKHSNLLKTLDERSLKSAVLLEADVTRDLRRLYEGHGAIMEKLDTLAEQEQVDEHESDISIMKDAIKLMRQELNELKKAQ